MKEANRAPFYACLYHALCDTARKHGYALAIHGTVTSDLDLIAIPWVEAPDPPQVMVDALRKHIGMVTTVHEELLISGATQKPQGRLAWNLYMDFGAKVDLSVMPPQESVFAEIVAEVGRATAKFPTWPTDALHAVGVVGEEMGELQKEVMQLTYEPHKSTKDSVRKEAVQLAAMSLRFLMSLDRYEYEPRPQHSQNDQAHLQSGQENPELTPAAAPTLLGAASCSALEGVEKQGNSSTPITLGREIIGEQATYKEQITMGDNYYSEEVEFALNQP